MQTKSKVSAYFGGPLSTAVAASLIWIPLTMGVSAHAQASAQQSEPGAEVSAAVASSPVVPQQVRYAGKLANRVGETVEANFRIYAAAEGGEPLWTETQRIPVGEDGSYTVLLGSGASHGLPQTVFAGGVARWLGVSVDGVAESERPMACPCSLLRAPSHSPGGLAAVRPSR